jgi:hypothetical protein
MNVMNLVDSNTGEITRVWDGRKTMRTLADALAKLDELGALAANGKAEIVLSLLGLPDGRVVGSLNVAASQGEARWRVMMPAAVEATAKDTLGAPVRLDIERLHGAVADPHGTLQLRDGTYVHALELVPVHLTERLTVEQEEILGHVIRFLEAERECFRSVHESVPWLVALDYAAIAQLWERRLQEGKPPPSLKAIERYVIDRMPNVSRQTIANVLALAGLRRPRSGPRARQRGRNGQAATI